MTEPIDDISQDELVELPGTVRKPAAAGEDKASASNMPSCKSRNRRSREPAQKPGEQPSTRQAPARSTLTAERKTHAWVLLVATLLTFGAYLNALEGDFVYDDTGDIALWEYGVRRDPSSPVAYIFLGDGYMRAARLGEAREAFSRAVELRPDSTNANVAMGMLASREGRYEEAEAYLKRVLEVYPDDYAALEQLGLAFQHQGKVSEAIELFDRGRVIMPYKRAVYTINMAVLYKTSNRPLEAQRELESLLPQLETAVTTKRIDSLVVSWRAARGTGAHGTGLQRLSKIPRQDNGDG